MRRNNLHSGNNIRIVLTPTVITGGVLTDGTPASADFNCKCDDVTYKVTNTMMHAAAFCDIVEYPLGSKFPELKQRDITLELKGFETYVDTYTATAYLGNFERAVFAQEVYRVTVIVNNISAATGVANTNYTVISDFFMITKGQLSASGDVIKGDLSFEGVK